MNNDINEISNNNVVNEHKKKVPKSYLFKINFSQNIGNKKNQENPKSNSKNNMICLSPNIHRRKSTNINNVKIYLKNSLKTKNNLKNQKIKDMESINVKSNKENESNKGLMSPKPRKSINYSKYNLIKIKNNNSPGNEIVKLFHFANNLYQKDEHFNKNIISKNIDINNIPSNKSNHLFGITRVNSQRKKKLVIRFGLNEDNSNNNKIFKRKISNATKGKESSDFNQSKKNSFSNYLENYSRNKTPINRINSEVHQNDNFTKNKFLDNKKSNIFEMSGNLSSKNKKVNLLFAKTFKKENIYLEKISEENLLNKLNKKTTIKSNKNNNKNLDTLTSINNKMNCLDNEIKKENSKNEQNNNNIVIKKKKKKFFLFCCLFSNDDNSD
jgi:hypothetical protein